jgi:hypothetical protein
VVLRDGFSLLGVSATIVLRCYSFDDADGNRPTRHLVPLDAPCPVDKSITVCAYNSFRLRPPAITIQVAVGRSILGSTQLPVREHDMLAIGSGYVRGVYFLWQSGLLHYIFPGFRGGWHRLSVEKGRMVKKKKRAAYWRMESVYSLRLPCTLQISAAPHGEGGIPQQLHLRIYRGASFRGRAGGQADDTGLAHGSLGTEVSGFSLWDS